MESFLEILKYTLPSLIVFVTAYQTLKTYLDDKQQTNLMAQRTESLRITLPVRLQAYERLMLLCDRVAIHNVLLRIRSQGMTVAELRSALMLSIRQEFDHNTSQQLYVSETLWKIISLAKDETLSYISQASDGLDPHGPDDRYVAVLLQGLDEYGYAAPLLKAIIAIRTEVGQLF
jgi:hypothetical protein